MDRIRKRTEAQISAGRFFLWVDEKPVSMALISPPTGDSQMVGGVYTPPALRGKGYATSCVAKLSQRVLDSGVPSCRLFTDLANPTSNKIYARIGYHPVADFEHYLFE